MKKEKVLVQCVVNGEEVAEYVDPRESLLDMLRNHLGLTSVKKGCEVGECGACTVIIDGETIDSCIYLAVWAEGKNIRTLEGLEKNGELTRIQEAFIEEGAIQCGFCTPGFVMSATVLLEQGYPANYQIIVDRVHSTDTLDVQVEMTPEMFTDKVGEVDRRQKELVDGLRSMLGLSAKVTLVAPKSIVRSEGKAVRVIDKRKI